MEYIQNTDCKEWQFKNIPEFNKGIMFPVFVDCGTGTKDETKIQTTDNTFMHFFDEVNECDVFEYCKILENAGIERIYENKIENNLFYQYKVQEGLLYISYFANTGRVKIILDRCDTTPVKDFGYCDYENINDDSVFSQYSLFYDAMTRGISADCGMNYLFRLRDNSFIIIDGGILEQCTDIAVEEYMKLLRTLSGNSGKIRVSLWLCTHPHDDHMDFMSKLIRIYGDEIQVERIAYNFTSINNSYSNETVSVMKERMTRKYPNASYIKFHAGTKFSIANAEVSILTSVEDVPGIRDDAPIPKGCNDYSCIFTVEVDGIKALFLADAGKLNGGVLVDNYSENILKCNFMQVAHHGINSIYEIYDKIKTEKVMLPQCKMNMDTRFSETYKYLSDRYGEENICLAHTRTDIFTIKDGTYTHTYRPQVGSVYDNSEL